MDAIRWPNRSPIFCDGSRPLVDRIASDRSAPRLAGIRSAEAGGRAAFLVDYRQDPPILTPEYTGRVWIRDLGRYGDVPTVTTSRLTSQGNDLIEETWPRTRTETIGEDDEMVSRFDMSWPASEVLRWIDYGYDSQNIIHIATAEGEVTELGHDTGFSIWLRVAPPNLPRAPVVKINDHVQYSSHMVNLSFDYFVEKLSDSTQLFAEHFRDAYDEIAFSVHRPRTAGPRFSHGSIRYPVGGINNDDPNPEVILGDGATRVEYEDSATTYGLSRLQSFLHFSGPGLPESNTSIHETTHQWGDYFELVKMAGYKPVGHQPWGHTGLLFPHESFLGNVFRGPNREVIRIGGDLYEIAHVARPRLHPLHLYAMGLLPASAVPDMVVFEDQWQGFKHDTRLLSGGSRIVTMADILAEYGPRTGPVYPEWRRATIVLSLDGLMTQAEMDYYNFSAKRMGEKFLSAGGFGPVSFYEAADGRMRLRTDIEPKEHPVLRWAEPTVLRDYGRTAWRDVVLDAPVPSWFMPNEPYTFSGRVLNDAYDEIEICLIRRNYPFSTRSCLEASLSADGRFSVPHRFGEAGKYEVHIDLRYAGFIGSVPGTHVSGFIVSPCLGQAGPARISLQTHDGHYLAAERGGGGKLSANRKAGVGLWDAFTIVDPNGGCVANGDVVRLRTSAGSYLRAVNGGAVDAAGTAADPWGAFRITRARGGGPLRTTDMVRLQAPNGQYVIAENGGGAAVTANRATPGAYGTFTLEPQPFTLDSNR